MYYFNKRVGLNGTNSPLVCNRRGGWWVNSNVSCGPGATAPQAMITVLEATETARQPNQNGHCPKGCNILETQALPAKCVDNNLILKNLITIDSLMGGRLAQW